MSADKSQAWFAPQLMGSVQAALSTPWILDIDTTIKPLYGKQSGAEVSYNPHKPGRPSHALHTYWVGNLRRPDLYAQVRLAKGAWGCAICQ